MSGETQCVRCGQFHTHPDTTRARLVTWLRRRDGSLCWLCYEPMDFGAATGKSAAAPSIDHVIERKNGGCRHPSNIRLAHYFCNTARANGDPREMRGYRKVLRQLRVKNIRLVDAA